MIERKIPNYYFKQNKKYKITSYNVKITRGGRGEKERSWWGRGSGVKVSEWERGEDEGRGEGVEWDSRMMLHYSLQLWN
jgi:hypothetical protein